MKPPVGAILTTILVRLEFTVDFVSTCGVAKYSMISMWDEVWEVEGKKQPQSRRSNYTVNNAKNYAEFFFVTHCRSSSSCLLLLHVSHHHFSTGTFHLRNLGRPKCKTDEKQE